MKSNKPFIGINHIEKNLKMPVKSFSSKNFKNTFIEPKIRTLLKPFKGLVMCNTCDPIDTIPGSLCKILKSNIMFSI